jgi:hypothetical protein
MALTKLETDHEMTGSKVSKYLEELKQKWPRLVPKYLRSDSLKGPLSVLDSPDRTAAGKIEPLWTWNPGALTAPCGHCRGTPWDLLSSSRSRRNQC